MMYLPKMPYEGGKNQKQIITFSGVNYGQGARDGELLESTNLSSVRYPCH